MDREQVHIGVVGVGHLGRLHALRLKEIDIAELVGVYDLDGDRARTVAREADTRAFPTFDALLDSVEALSIVTPTSTHYEYARAALLAGKHLFIEKPMTATLEQADELNRLAAEKGRKLQVGHIERFNPAIMALEHLHIHPLFIEAHRMANFNPRGTDVAVVMDLMIHDIDLILSFVKSPVKEVHASGASVISASEDIANCRLLFENGCVANVTASRISARPMRKMRFFQPDAYISVDFLAGESEIYYIDQGNFRFDRPIPATFLGQLDKGQERKNIFYARIQKADINPLQYELTLFCRAILEDTSPPVTGEDGRRALRIARIILQRIEEHLQMVQAAHQI
ncbi:MAG: gfo/Idh/MocA family oxidoreductase [Calditrichaeota bacterium]|nr:MAG: gfo/Idh/MocA family oxidoreductase [Calditrichota bacterium]